MAIGSTMYTFDVQLADTDRGVYAETDAYMLTRVLAYGLEYTEGIAFGGSVSSTEEPAVLVRDLTGLITAWIEVGAPDAERLHYGSRIAERTVVYTHRDPAKVMALWVDKRIHRASEIRVYSFDPGFIDSAVPALERRNTLTITITEQTLYLSLNGVTLSTAVHEHELG
ncbi:MAG: YaeQ family protein [Microbacterium sp.]|uniref:YaeQ family protein n=1 Tax=Microbacterium sp. TaxID=51671 RepID=UPI001D8A54F7|nr:YaeQ family protein [Microbacterium sp.]MBW8762760.1 YaeQ family protein [Microbacterium sp.]